MALLTPAQQRRVEELMTDAGISRAQAEDIVKNSASDGVCDLRFERDEDTKE